MTGVGPEGSVERIAAALERIADVLEQWRDFRPLLAQTIQHAEGEDNPLGHPSYEPNWRKD